VDPRRRSEETYLLESFTLETKSTCLFVYQTKRLVGWQQDTTAQSG
jgi:hypothetical protein